VTVCSEEDRGRVGQRHTTPRHRGRQSANCQYGRRRLGVGYRMAGVPVGRRPAWTGEYARPHLMSEGRHMLGISERRFPVDEQAERPPFGAVGAVRR
jgi:hypothetical protein